jgi:hypothetical protein
MKAGFFYIKYNNFILLSSGFGSGCKTGYYNAQNLDVREPQ